MVAFWLVEKSEKLKNDGDVDWLIGTDYRYQKTFRFRLKIPMNETINMEVHRHDAIIICNDRNNDAARV